MPFCLPARVPFCLQAAATAAFLAGELAEAEGVAREAEAARRQAAARYGFCVLDTDGDGYVAADQVGGAGGRGWCGWVGKVVRLYCIGGMGLGACAAVLEQAGFFPAKV